MLEALKHPFLMTCTLHSLTKKVLIRNGASLMFHEGAICARPSAYRNIEIHEGDCNGRGFKQRFGVSLLQTHVVIVILAPRHANEHTMVLNLRKTTSP
jgi:hypothetical protein